jgi:hypothetical protein
MKLARSTSLIGLNSQLKLNSKILRTWKKENESVRSLNLNGWEEEAPPAGPFIGEPKDHWAAKGVAGRHQNFKF